MIKEDKNMDVLGVQQMKMKRHQQKRCNSNKKKSGTGVKVVYISSPMKVNTCASKFRALVQELTGKDSNAASHFPDPYSFDKSPEAVPYRRESPTFSDDTSEPISTDDDDVFGLYREGSFLGMFSSNLFSDHSFPLEIMP